MIEKNVILLGCQWTLSDLGEGQYLSGKIFLCLLPPSHCSPSIERQQSPQQVKNLRSEGKLLGSGPDSCIWKVLRKSSFENSGYFSQLLAFICIDFLIWWFLFFNTVGIIYPNNVWTSLTQMSSNMWIMRRKKQKRNETKELVQSKEKFNHHPSLELNLEMSKQSRNFHHKNNKADSQKRNSLAC